MTFNYPGFFAAMRPLFGGRLSQAQVDGINAALKIGFQGSADINVPQPAWLVEARKWDGTAEIGNTNESPTIRLWLANLGWSWLKSAPWCGVYLSQVFKAVGLAGPPEGYRAKDWATWGVSVTEQLGAVGVKLRAGGGHVFLIVGQTQDRKYYKALGGNQGNKVGIIDIPKAEVFAVRWPSSVREANLPLPVMAPGPIGASEA